MDRNSLEKANGFSLHAGVSCEGHQKEKRERLCRYIARPAVAVPRLSLSSTGKVVYTVTANLSIDYAGTAKLGDWIEIEVDVQKVGKSMAFANCYFYVGSKRVARASAVFNVVNA